MNGSERLTTASLAALFALRMLGLFMLLPVFSLYYEGYVGASELTLGIAIGAYGLTQAFFQIPFGMLSDRWGRKPLILGGLVLFAVGGVVAAQAESMWGVIAGRALQGAGAIASTVLALATDLVREQHRSKAMAMIGMSIGLSFMLAVILGPGIADALGMSGLFYSTTVLALIGMVITAFAIPKAQVLTNRDTIAVGEHLLSALKHRELSRLDLGVFVLHAAMTANFIAIPLVLMDMGWEASEHWLFYLPILAISFVLMVPLMIVAEKKQQIKPVLLIAIAVLAIGEVILAFYADASMWVFFGLLVFFWGFNLLEAMMPSLVGKYAPAGTRGSSMGLYSSAQFLGAFCGGAVGGYALSQYGVQGVFVFTVAACLVWLAVAATMKAPPALRSETFSLRHVPSQDVPKVLNRLLAIPGVEEAVVITEEKAAYLKVDKSAFDAKHLYELIVE